MPMKMMAEIMSGQTTFAQAETILGLLRGYQADETSREHDILVIQAALRYALADGAKTNMASLAPEQPGHAVIALAQRGCNGRQPCGAERRLPGSKNKPMRCTDCPLDDVDCIADGMTAP